MKKSIIAIIAALNFTTAAHADPIPGNPSIPSPSKEATVPEWNLSGNITASSDYRFRGVSQTKLGPEISGNINLMLNSGIYIGTFVSNVNSEYYTGGAGYEEDFYAGVKKEVVKGLTLDVGSCTDIYYKASNAGSSYTTSEVYVGASYGPLSVKGNHAFTDYFGTPNTHGTHYVTADLAQPVGPITLIAHAAHTFVAHQHDYNYSDYNVGVSYNLTKSWNLTGLYYFNRNEGQAMKDINTLGGHKLYGNNFVVALKKSF